MFLFLLFGAALAARNTVGCFSAVDTSNSRGLNAYQTSDLCAALCGSQYPYIAIQNGDCYCLSALPTLLVALAQCNVKCFGYGYQMCGSDTTFTVFNGLNNNAVVALPLLLTQSTAQPLSLSRLLTLLPPLTLTLTLSLAQTLSSSLQTLAPSLSLLALLSSSESLGSPTTQIVTTTVANRPKVITTTAQDTASLAQPLPLPLLLLAPHKKLTNVGAIAGGTVGGVAAVAALAALIFFCIRRSGRSDDEEEFVEKDAGLTRGTGTSKLKKFNSAFDMPMTNPFSDEFADKRASRVTQPPLVDPRLNPVMLGRRRLSEGSLADEADYSRKILGVANP